MSCKEVSSFLLSVFGHPVVGPPNSGPIKDSNQLPGNIASRTGSVSDLCKVCLPILSSQLFHISFVLGFKTDCRLYLQEC